MESKAGFFDRGSPRPIGDLAGHDCPLGMGKNHMSEPWIPGPKQLVQIWTQVKQMQRCWAEIQMQLLYIIYL